MGNKLDLSFVAITLGTLGILTLGIVAILIFGRRTEEPAQVLYHPAPIISSMPKEEKHCSPCVAKTEEVRPTKPHIINHILNDAGTWYEIRLPVDMVTWQMRARGEYDLLYSFEPTQSTTMVLPSGSVLNENTAPNMSIRSIYVMSETAGAQVDIEIWRNLG